LRSENIFLDADFCNKYQKSFCLFFGLLCLNECSVSTDWGVHKSSIFIHMKNMECQKLYLGYCLRSNNNWKSIMTKRFTITWNCPTNVHISLRYSPLRTADLEVTKLTGTIFNHPWSGVCRAGLPPSLPGHCTGVTGLSLLHRRVGSVRFLLLRLPLRWRRSWQGSRHRFNLLLHLS